MSTLGPIYLCNRILVAANSLAEEASGINLLLESSKFGLIAVAAHNVLICSSIVHEHWVVGPNLGTAGSFCARLTSLASSTNQIREETLTTAALT
jgi:hypothetical protein